MLKPSISLLVALLATCSVQAAPVALESATIADLNAAFKAGTLTSEQLVQLCLARIAAYDDRGPKINAVIAVHPQALEIDELIARSNRVTSLRADGAGPNEGRWNLFKREAASGKLDDYRYLSVRDHALPMMRQVVEGIVAKEKLDAIVYPTSPRRPGQIAAPPEAGGSGAVSATNIANLTGFPDLIVPAGFTSDDLPVGLSFFGLAFSEPTLLALGYSFEQLTHARRLPVTTPALAGETIDVR